MVGLGNHVLTKAMLLILIISVGLRQQTSADAPSPAPQKVQDGIKASPLSYKEYLSRADTDSKLGQYQKQIDDLTSAIELAPTVADLYERRAQTYYQLGELQNAIADCTKATSLNPVTSAAYLTAAQAYEELGLYDKAIELRTELLGFKTSGAFDWSNRAKDYERLGKFDLARADRQKAIELASPSEQAEMQLSNPLVDLKLCTGEGSQAVIRKGLKGNSVVLPFHYDLEGHICVPAQINGRALQLMLDTGCAHSDLWKQAMPGVVKADEVHPLSIKVNGKEYHSGLVRAQDLTLGSLTLPNVWMRIDDGLVGHKTLSGFLGGNILENFVVTVDYTKKQVILANSFEQYRLKSAIVVPMVLRDHRPHCNVRLDGKVNVMATFDTGSPFNLSADSLLEPVFNKKLNFNDCVSGPWLGSLNADTVRLKSLEVGASSIKAPIFDVFLSKDAPAWASEIYLGNTFLSRFKIVTFDYPARQLVLEPTDSVSESASSLYCEGKYYFQHNELQRAIDALSKSMKLDSEFAVSCYKYRAMVFVNLKQYWRALDDIKTAIKLDPRNASHYLSRAWVHQILGQYSLQIADDTDAIRLDPTYRAAYFNRAWAYDKLGKHWLAEKDRKQFSQL